MTCYCFGPALLITRIGYDWTKSYPWIAEAGPKITNPDDLELDL